MPFGSSPNLVRSHCVPRNCLVFENGARAEKSIIIIRRISSLLRRERGSSSHLLHRKKIAFFYFILLRLLVSTKMTVGFWVSQINNLTLITMII